MHRMHTIGFSAATSLLICCVGCNRPDPTAAQPTRQDASPPTGQAWGLTINGLQAGLDVKRPAEAGKPKPLLVLRVRNASDKPVRILKLSAQSAFWGENLPLAVRAGGKELKYRGPVLVPPPPPSRQAYIDLAPGKTDAVEVEMDPNHWGLKDTSRATVSFVFTNYEKSAFTSSGPDTVTGLWTGSARSPRMNLASGAVEQAANAGTLRGRALLKGKPVSDMRVLASVRGGVPVVAETRTDAEGRFTLRNLPRQKELTLVASKVREDYWWLQGEVKVTIGQACGSDIGDIQVGAIAPPTARRLPPPATQPTTQPR